jgi:23S rRNA (cytidine2498-2'-O)-methyltransferase
VVESRIDAKQLSTALSKPHAPLRAGEWLWTTREGAERDLIEELLWTQDPGIRPRLLGPALVASAKAPQLRDGRLDLTFARQGFQVASVARCDADEETGHALADALAPKLREAASGTEHALQVFVPDSTQGNTLSARAQALRDLLERDCPQTLDETQLRRQGGLLAQVCLFDAHTAALGCIPSERAQSPWPGGRARMRLGGEFPSRAARKLAEAFAWLGMAPGSGELCVDLGAAPGGWSWLLLEKRARVIAVDPARMDPKLMRNSRLNHVQGNAFVYEPEEPVDWLFCDMAYRPLEVAAMLGRWARRRHTRLLVANFKLPMKRKVEIVERIRGLLADSGFMSLRTRQLYHDRDEITLTAHVR